MALISCGECGKQISDKAGACPNCGAPVQQTQAASAPAAPKPEPPRTEPSATSAPVATTTAPEKRTNWTRTIIIAVAASVVGVVLLTQIPGVLGPTFTHRLASGRILPSKHVVTSERIRLAEGEAKAFGFALPGQSTVEVSVEASPKQVDVYLMTEAEWKKFKDANESFFGGSFTYRQSRLSSKSILRMDETDDLPFGSYRVVVRRPNDSLLFGDDTAATVNITATY